MNNGLATYPRMGLGGTGIKALLLNPVYIFEIANEPRSSQSLAVYAKQLIEKRCFIDATGFNLLSIDTE